MGQKGYIWKLYKKVNKDLAECTMCSEKISTAGRSSSGLIRHAERFHERELKLAREYTEKSAFQDNSILTLLSLAFTTAAIPFSFIQNTYLKEFLKNVGIQSISPDSIKNKIESMAESSRALVEKEVNKYNNFTITCDGWTSLKSNFSAYCLFVIFIDENYKRHIHLVGCKGIRGPATSENVGKLLSEMLESVNLSLSNVSQAVTDSGSNLVKLFKTLDITRIMCICHVLALFFKDVFKSNHLETLLKKSTSTASILCRSNLLREKFHQFAKIVKDVTIPRSFSLSRWGGSYLLLKQFLESVPVLLSIPELAHNIPSVEENEVGSNVVDMLDEVFKFMTRMESDHSTASSVIPNIVAIEKYLTNHPKSSTQIGKYVRLLFKNRTAEVLDNKDMQLLCFLDPRFSYHEGILSKTQWSKIEKMFIKKHEKESSDLPDSSGAVSEDHCEKNENLSPLAQLMSTKTVSKQCSTLTHEISKFKNHLLVDGLRPDTQSDPLDFWSLNKAKFPQLAVISRHTLSVPSSSAATERLFSKASHVTSNARRNRMNSSTLDSILQVSSRAQLIHEGSKIFKLRDTDDEDSDDDDSESDVHVSKSHSLKSTKRRHDEQITSHILSKEMSAGNSNNESNIVETGDLRPEGDEDERLVDDIGKRRRIESSSDDEMA